MRHVYLCALLPLFTLPTCLSQTPISQRQACAKFSDAVVSITAGGQSWGTGFIVSPDGYILTASHVIRDETSSPLSYYSAISVKMPDGSSEMATPAIPLSADNFGQDFALLRLEKKNTKAKLPFLTLGTVKEVVLGGDATIIGYPLSAINAEGRNIFTKFCIAAEFAATDLVSVPVSVTNKNATGATTTTENDIKVDVIYFEGPSVKGISGSPIISRDTGNVVGIVTLKLSGIGQSLMDLKTQTANGLGGGISLSGLEPGKAVNQIVTVLDDQLANNLGAATGIDDPKYALTKAERHPKQ